VKYLLVVSLAIFSNLHAGTCEFSDWSVSKKLEYARLAIEFLGEKYESYDSAAYLKDLRALEKMAPSHEKVDSFRYRALVVNNPELDFDQILFRRSSSGNLPTNWRGNSHYLRRAGSEFRPKFEDSIERLNLKTGETEPSLLRKTVL